MFVTALIILSGIVTAVSVIPYLIAIVRGKTKPRIVSWFTWSMLTGIACAAAFTDGQVATGILLLCCTMGVLSVVILGFKHGDRKFERIDIVCQLAVLVGLALWLLFNSPAVAVMAVVVIDIIGVIPTAVHSWQKPSEETWITFALGGAGAAITLFIVTDWRITAVVYPIYLVVANALIVLLILCSPHRRARTEPAELREL